MSILVGCLAALICFGTAYFTLDPAWVARVSLLHPRESEEHPEPQPLRPALHLIAAVAIGLTAGFAAYRAWDAAPDWIQRTKVLCALVLVVGAGCIDMTEYRIPNLFPLALALCGIVLLAVGLLTGQEGAFSFVTTSVLAAVICAACAGFRALIGVVFYGMLSCALTAVVLLLSKKKTIHDSVPFGPFIVFGYIITLYVRYF